MPRYAQMKMTFNDLFPVATPDEVAERKSKYISVKLKEAFNVKKTQLPDGSWHIHDSLDVNACRLTTLKDLNVSIVDGDFNCSYNDRTSLEGSPKNVTGDFICAFNNLTSLKGVSKVIGKDFMCNSNLLRSLKGCPKEIGGSFYCDTNALTSLEGCPDIVKGYFICYDNVSTFTKAIVKRLCKVKKQIYV